MQVQATDDFPGTDPPEPQKVNDENEGRAERSTMASIKAFNDNPEDNHNNAGELFDDEDHATDDSIYDLMDIGRFDQTDKDGLDKSREETRSSWSSSEEALANCEGLIFNVPLNGGRQCTRNASIYDLNEIRTTVELEVSESGFYYFIFANENEITDNFLSAKFDLHKTVFDVSQNERNCTESTHCELPLKFWSEDHVVLEV